MYCVICKKLVSEADAVAEQKKNLTAYYCPHCKRRLLSLGQEKGFVSSRDVLADYDRRTVQDIPEKLQRINYERPVIDTKIDELLDVLKYAPHNANARFDLALIYYAQSQLPKAMEQFQQILRIAPGHGPTLHKLLNIYTAEEKFDQAIETALMLLEAESDNVDIMFHLALLYLHEKQVANAETLLRQLTRLRPNHTEAHTLLAELAT